jgi:DNA-binding NarL/FixJ family response regulator
MLKEENRVPIHEACKPEKSRILMVDDHPIVRQGMAQFLNLQDDLRLCCEAGNAEEAMAAMAACNHALAIIDISLDGDSGLGLIKTLHHRYPGLALLAMSMHDESLFAERTLRAGASGYLMKQEATENILLAIRQVLSGDIYLSAAMHSRLLRRLVAPRGGVPGPIAGLSEREFEVLHFLGLGFGTRQIAEKLHRSIKTIEAHRASLKEKLGLKSATELVRFAVQQMEGE